MQLITSLPCPKLCKYYVVVVQVSSNYRCYILLRCDALQPLVYLFCGALSNQPKFEIKTQGSINALATATRLISRVHN